MLQATFTLSLDRNNAWEWSYGKHDKSEFTGLNIVLVGCILDVIFWIAIIRVGIFQVGVVLGGNFPGENFPDGSLTWVGIFLVGIVRVGVILGGNFPGGNCPGGSYPGWGFSR